MKARSRLRTVLTIIISICAGVAGIAGLAAWTASTRASVGVYTALLSAANQQDVEAATALCSSRYRASHTLRPAPDGGLIGLPRNIHKNFQVWRHSSNVWLCPTNRVGPVYQFVYERDAWRFDGPIGVLMPGNRVERLEDSGVAEEEVTTGETP
jgi:hypothetical protein